MSKTLTTLIENNPSTTDPDLYYEHGLSLYIELPSCTILFDTGQSGNFLDNASYLHKDLSKVDYLLISHGHYDHSSGIPRLLDSKRLSHKVKMYVGQGFFNPKCKQTEDGTYVPRKNPFTKEDILSANIELREMQEDTVYLNKEVMIFRNFPRTNEFELVNPNFFVYKNGERQQDYFDDEIVLGIKTDKGLVLVVGCSHIGIINILTEVKKRVNMPIYMVVGGTHLMVANEERVQKTIDAWKELGVQRIAVSHCTGRENIAQLRDCFQDKFVYNNTGNVISLDE